MKFVNDTTVPFTADQIDLPQWLFTMTDQEYQAVSPAHRALGTFIADGVRGMVNVEVMGGALVIQHYREVQATKSRVEMYSARSRAYLMHVIPVSMEVRWTMSVTPRTADTSTFLCSVEVVPPAWLRSLMGVIGIRRAVRKHVEQETEAYAADLSRKLQPEIVHEPKLGADERRLHLVMH
jgi:hypothetical protein